MAFKLQRLAIRALSTRHTWMKQLTCRLSSSQTVNEHPEVENLQKKGDDDVQVVLSTDESMYIAWHPKKDFPYECTRPLPKVNVEETASVLKTQLTPEVLQVFKKKTPEQAIQELMNITHTTKHRWFPRARDKRAKKTPMQREYL